MGRTKTVSDTELLDAARRVFVEEGFAASTRAIARSAGVSEDVIFAAMIPPPVDLNRLLHHPRSKGRGLVEKVTLSLIQYFRATLPVFIPLMSHPSFRFEEFARRHPDSPMVTLRRHLVEFVVQQQRAGRIGAVDPGAAALLMWSTAHSIAFFEHLGAHGGQFDPRIIRATIQGLWNGLAPPVSSRSLRARG